jgi:hypothetical protein
MNGDGAGWWLVVGSLTTVCYFIVGHLQSLTLTNCYKTEAVSLEGWLVARSKYRITTSCYCDYMSVSKSSQVGSGGLVSKIRLVTSNNRYRI